MADDNSPVWQQAPLSARAQAARDAVAARVREAASQEAGEASLAQARAQALATLKAVEEVAANDRLRAARNMAALASRAAAASRQAVEPSSVESEQNYQMAMARDRALSAAAVPAFAGSEQQAAAVAETVQARAQEARANRPAPPTPGERFGRQAHNETADLQHMAAMSQAKAEWYATPEGKAAARGQGAAQKQANAAAEAEERSRNVAEMGRFGVAIKDARAAFAKMNPAVAAATEVYSRVMSLGMGSPWARATYQQSTELLSTKLGGWFSPGVDAASRNAQRASEELDEAPGAFKNAARIASGAFVHHFTGGMLLDTVRAARTGKGDDFKAIFRNLLPGGEDVKDRALPVIPGFGKGGVMSLEAFAMQSGQGNTGMSALEIKTMSETLKQIEEILAGMRDRGAGPAPPPWRD